MPPGARESTWDALLHQQGLVLEAECPELLELLAVELLVLAIEPDVAVNDTQQTLGTMHHTTAQLRVLAMQLPDVWIDYANDAARCHDSTLWSLAWHALGYHHTLCIQP